MCLTLSYLLTYSLGRTKALTAIDNRHHNVGVSQSRQKFFFSVATDLTAPLRAVEITHLLTYEMTAGHKSHGREQFDNINVVSLKFLILPTGMLRQCLVVRLLCRGLNTTRHVDF